MLHVRRRRNSFASADDCMPLDLGHGLALLKNAQALDDGVGKPVS